MNNIFPWQNEIWKILTKNKSSIGHAILLKGKKGIGKLEFAKSLAKSLLCEDLLSENQACGSCSGCRWFEQAGHPDFYLVEPEALSETLGESKDRSSSAKLKKKPSKQVSVAQIRALNDVVNMSSHRNGYKIVIINPAEAMNVAAANALLKNLEEPPPQTLFILVTHRPYHILPTIHSRCRQIAMPVPDFNLAIDWLEKQDIEGAEDSLAAFGYAPLAALEYNNGDYRLEHESFINNISVLNGLNPILLAEELQKSDLPTTISWLQKWCYDLMSCRTTGKIRYHLSMQARIEELVPKIDPLKLAGYLRNLIDMQRLAHHTLNPRLFLEEAFISYAMLMAPARSNQRG